MDSVLLSVAAATQAFDVGTATQAYLGTLQGAARAKSDAYFEGGYWLLLWNALVAGLLYYAMLRFGWSARWRDWAARVTRRRPLQAMIYAVPFVIVGALLVLPWTIYTTYFRERQYGLMNQSFGGWLTEYAIQLGVSVVMTALLFAIIFAVIRKAPESWWLWGTGAVAALIAFSVLIAPVFISPLFNKYEPMAPGPMRDQILAMARQQNVPADNVYVFDASKQTKRISANVSGLGPTIRISLNDNLLNRSTPEGVKAVMGHELGHYVLGHVWKLILQLSLVILAAMFMLWWLAPRILARYGARWRVTGVDDVAVTPLFGLLLTGFFLLATPVLNSIIRSEESQADAFGLDAAREPDGFAQTAMQLSEYRKIEPSALEEAIFFDHPSGRTRVRMAMEWKARHLAELPPEKRAMVVPPPGPMATP